MPVEVVWSNRADAELIDLAALISVHRPTAADRLVRRLLALAHLLSDHPRMGARRPDIAPGYRALTERPYMIFYRNIPDSDVEEVTRVEIVSIVDGRRDLSRLF